MPPFDTARASRGPAQGERNPFVLSETSRSEVESKDVR